MAMEKAREPERRSPVSVQEWGPRQISLDPWSDGLIVELSPSG